MILPWVDLPENEAKEVKEGNQVRLTGNIEFHLNHDTCTALMNENSASEEDRQEACKFIASLGYTPVEYKHG